MQSENVNLIMEIDERGPKIGSNDEASDVGFGWGKDETVNFLQLSTTYARPWMHDIAAM